MADTMVQTKKLIKVGNSAALTFDAEYLRTHGFVVGEEVVIRYSDDGVLIAIPKKVLQNLRGTTENQKMETVSSKITPELIAWTENFIKENKGALVKLANL